MINQNILTHNKRILATEIVFIWNDDLETINTGIFVASATNNHSGHENSFFFFSTEFDVTLATRDFLSFRGLFHTHVCFLAIFFPWTGFDELIKYLQRFLWK